MGDHEDGALSTHAVEIFPERLFGLVVQRTGGFVEHQHGGVVDQGPGQGHGLALSRGQPPAPFLHHGVVALGQGGDPLVGPGNAGHLDDPRVVDVLPPAGDVLPDAAVKQHAVLRHHADLLAQPSGGHAEQVEAVDGHHATGRRIQPLQQLDQGRLAGTRRPDHPDQFPGLDGEGDVLQHVGPLLVVAKGHAVEPHLPANRRQHGIAIGGGWLHRCIHDVGQPPQRNPGAGQLLPQLRHALDRRDHATAQHVEGDQLANGKVAVQHQLGTEVEQADGKRLAQQPDELVDEVGQVRACGGALGVLGQAACPVPLARGLHGIGLHRLDADQGLHQEGLVLRGELVAILETVPHPRGHHQGNNEEQRQRQQHDGGQARAEQVHHGQEDDDEDDVHQQGQGGPGEKLAHRLQLANPRHGVSAGSRLEVGQRQLHQVTEQPHAEFHVDAVAGVRHQVGADAAKQHVEQADHHQREDQHVQGGQVVVGEDLVDHQHEDDGRRQGEQLQEHRGQQGLAHDAPVTEQRAQEPAQAERGPAIALAGRPRLGPGEDGPAAGQLAKRPDGQRVQPVMTGSTPLHDAVFHRQQQGVGAVLQRHDGRQRDPAQVAPVQWQQAGAKAAVTQHANQLPTAHAVGRTVAMGQVGHVQPMAMHPRQQGDGLQGAAHRVLAGGVWVLLGLRGMQRPCLR